MDPPCREGGKSQQLVEEASYCNGGGTDQVGKWGFGEREEEEGHHQSSSSHNQSVPCFIKIRTCCKTFIFILTTF